MARSLRDLRRKIKGVKSTRQVTKAMELVSASKMRKAIQSTTVLRRYSLTIWEILQRVAQMGGAVHPALQPRPVQKVLAILFTPDRGLAGNLNAHLARMVLQYMKGLQGINTFKEIEFIAVGKKGQQLLLRTQQKVIAAFPAFSVQPSFRDIIPIAKIALEGFQNGKYDHVTVVYADFISPLVQQPNTRVLLPLSQTDLKAMLDSMLPKSAQTKAPDSEQSIKAEYGFEPSPEEVLTTLLPQVTELQIYQALLEATASEHSARMVAMRNASDNASDIIDDLTLTYNQTRQGNITAELAELSASKAALD